MNVRRFVSGLSAFISLIFTVLFVLAFIQQYWIWRDCFNELGRCYDPASQQVYLEQAGGVWFIMGLVSLITFMFSVRTYRKSHSRGI